MCGSAEARARGDQHDHVAAHRRGSSRCIESGRVLRRRRGKAGPPARLPQCERKGCEMRLRHSRTRGDYLFLINSLIQNHQFLTLGGAVSMVRAALRVKSSEFPRLRGCGPCPTARAAVMNQAGHHRGAPSPRGSSISASGSTRSSRADRRACRSSSTGTRVGNGARSPALHRAGCGGDCRGGDRLVSRPLARHLAVGVHCVSVLGFAAGILNVMRSAGLANSNQR